MHPRLTVWVACLAQLVVVLDVSVVNVALPSIQQDLGLGAAATTGVATAYGVTFAGALLVAARLADVVGAARVLLYSVAAFTAASVVGGLATGGPLLIAARGGQGLAAAAIAPATFTLLLLAFPEGAGRTRAVATWTAVSVAGGGAGNVASGLLTEWVSWRAVLLINLPIGLVIVLGASRLLQPRVGRTGTRVPWSSAVVSVGAFAAVVHGLTLWGEGRVEGLVVAAVLATGAALGAILVRLERRSPAPLIPISLWRRRSARIGGAATLLMAMCFQVALWYFLTFRLQQQGDYSPVATGLAFAPMTVALVAVNLVAVPRLTPRLGRPALVVAGVGVALVGIGWLAATSSTAFWPHVLVPTVLVGVGGGLLNTPLAELVTSGVSVGEAGAASGLLNTAKQVGGAVGLAAATVAVGGAGSDRAAFASMGLALALSAVFVAGPLNRPEAPGRSKGLRPRPGRTG